MDDSETTALDSSPILVTGPNRSGTTWMQWFLSQHPRIHIHGQSPNIRWHVFWGFYQTLVEQGEWARRANLQVGYEIAHYAGSPLERAHEIFCRALRGFLTGFGPAKPRWGLKWLDLCSVPGAADEFERLWPDARWVVCLRDPFTTIASAKNTFVPHLDERRQAETWVRTCRFVETWDPRRVAVFQIDALGRQTGPEREAAMRRVLECVGEEPCRQTSLFLREWPVVHKVKSDVERSYTLSEQTRERLLATVPDLAESMRRWGYPLPPAQEPPASADEPTLQNRSEP